jgi:hypothetical protein
MVFSLFYWNINSDPNKKFILLKLGTENELELMKLQIRTGNLSIELKSKAEMAYCFLFYSLNW